MKKEPTYKEKVFSFLDKMEAGIKPLSELCKPETREQFIKIVKAYIDRGVVNGYTLEFNSDWTAIKKFDTILRTSIQEFKESI